MFQKRSFLYQHLSLNIDRIKISHQDSLRLRIKKLMTILQYFKSMSPEEQAVCDYQLVTKNILNSFQIFICYSPRSNLCTLFFKAYYYFSIHLAHSLPSQPINDLLFLILRQKSKFTPVFIKTLLRINTYYLLHRLAYNATFLKDIFYQIA